MNFLADVFLVVVAILLILILIAVVTVSIVGRLFVLRGFDIVEPGMISQISPQKNYNSKS
jgi:hypothetical protein